MSNARGAVVGRKLGPERDGGNSSAQPIRSIRQRRGSSNGAPTRLQVKALRDFKFAIDRGGTFTDVFAEVPGEPGYAVCKLLSVDPQNYDDAPREGIRRILEEYTGQSIPRGTPLPTDRIEWIRMGTTVATNALLERKGEKSAVCLTKGLGDVLQIGTQARPDIFDLEVRMPSVLYTEAIEVDERVRVLTPAEASSLTNAEGAAKGYKKGLSGEWVEILQPIDLGTLRGQLQSLLDRGIRSLAVALAHSYTFPDHEEAIGRLAEQLGFTQISLSSKLIPMVKLVPRGQTATVDAYLTPKIQTYLSTFLGGFDEGLPNVQILFMQSDGGLTEASTFNGNRAILSGPAGGVVGYSLTTLRERDDQPVIGFDMGGTSTDVSRYDGSYDLVVETRTAGVTIQAPQLEINTVAAGGGSKLTFFEGVLKVGPESVSSDPGPVCYRKGGQLAVTDANLLLGRVVPKYFPKIFGKNEDQALDASATREAFESLTKEINRFRELQEGSTAGCMTCEEVAYGYLQVANEAMCRPIRELTEMKGHDTSNHILAVFGGAGPQHACAIARNLKMKSAFVHRFAGILSAYGMGLADVVEEAQLPCSLTCGAEGSLVQLEQRENELVRKIRESLQAQGFDDDHIQTTTFLNMRYEGTDNAIMTVTQGQGFSDGGYELAFLQTFQREFGFELKGRKLLVDDVRVRGVGKVDIIRPSPIATAVEDAVPMDHSQVYFQESGWTQTPIFDLLELLAGHALDGPCLILNGNSTIVIEPGCRAIVTDLGDVQILVGVGEMGSSGASTELDSVQLSIFSNRFMSIAEQMGRTLQRTSVSTNIKERLDFSCALFDAQGGLVANAPHIPVHLGAMSATVSWQLQHWGEDLQEGDVLLTNHPSAGGSHLPDITVVTPVFRDGQIVFFTASRGHHADVGGITPGSMPPFSRTLVQEGAAIKAFKLVEKGVFQEEKLRELLAEPGRHEGCSGTRKVEDVISDLRAQAAANNRGSALLAELIDAYGLDVVNAYMGHVQENAELAVRSMLRKMARDVLSRSGEEAVREDKQIQLRSIDFMDDGSPIQLVLTIDAAEGSAHFDFKGTGSQVYGNWNCPKAVTFAAIIYCLRALVGTEIPLNQGCFAPITADIPENSMLSPADGAAVVGGNVLTSQRVTDVVLAAFHAAANSQGCMNNFTFGNENFGYYETIAGGSGAGPTWDGTSGVQCHMTNTRITDPEILERRYPVLLREFSLRKGSGGRGAHKGGDGVVREMEFLERVTVSILSERRSYRPNGIDGGGQGLPGTNMLVNIDGTEVSLGGKNTILIEPHQRVRISTPGGGGCGGPVGEAG